MHRALQRCKLDVPLPAVGMLTVCADCVGMYESLKVNFQILISVQRGVFTHPLMKHARRYKMKNGRVKHLGRRINALMTCLLITSMLFVVSLCITMFYNLAMSLLEEQCVNAVKDRKSTRLNSSHP